MSVFLVGFMSQAEYECEQEQPWVQEVGLGDAAAPQVSAVLATRPTGEHGEMVKLREAVEADFAGEGCPTQLTWVLAETGKGQGDVLSMDRWELRDAEGHVEAQAVVHEYEPATDEPGPMVPR